MRAAFDCVDIVGKRENIFIVTVVVLEGRLHFGRVFFLIHIENFGMKRVFIPVQILNKLGDPIFVFKDVLLIGTLVLDRNLNSFIEEGKLSQAV